MFVIRFSSEGVPYQRFRDFCAIGGSWQIGLGYLFALAFDRSVCDRVSTGVARLFAIHLPVHAVSAVYGKKVTYIRANFSSDKQQLS